VNRRFIAAVAPLTALSALIVAGCAEPHVAASPEPAAPPLGVEWTSVDLTGPLADEDAELTEFSADGVLWVIDEAVPTTLFGTTDGISWREVDLTTHGLPPRVSESSDCRQQPVIDARPDGLTLVYSERAHDHPVGLRETVWLVDVDDAGERISVTPGADAGFENMPPATEGDQFRTRCLVNIVSLGETRYAFGGGQWWSPYDTGRRDYFTAREVAPNDWEVYSARTSPVLEGVNAELWAGGMLSTGSSLVLIDTGGGTAEFWHSVDGRDWLATENSPEVNPSAIGAASHDGTLVVASLLGERPGFRLGIWSSTNGAEWTQVHFPEPVAEETPTVLATPEGFIVAASSSGTPFTWVSTDGTTWSELPSDYYLTGAIAHLDGLVDIGSSRIRVSGLDWGQAAE